MSEFANMNGPQLVTTYNEMAAKAGIPVVKRFADRNSAIKRCLTLASKVKQGQEETVTTSAKENPVVKKSASASGTKANGSSNKLAFEFGARLGTKRERLLIELHKNYRKQVPIKVLLKATYNRVNDEDKGALAMIIRGATVTIKKNRLPYQIKKEKNEAKETTIGLHPK